MILIIKDKDMVMLTRANQNGGRPLSGYPITEDPATGMWGYKLGYCDCGCNEPILMRTVDARAVVTHFGIAEEEYEEWKTKIIRKPKRPLRVKIIEFLGGKT
jgi:hypothetical protein